MRRVTIALLLGCIGMCPVMLEASKPASMGGNSIIVKGTNKKKPRTKKETLKAVKGPGTLKNVPATQVVNVTEAGIKAPMTASVVPIPTIVQRVEVHTVHHKRNKEKIVTRWQSPTEAALYTYNQYAYFIFDEKADFDTRHLKPDSDFHEAFTPLSLGHGSGFFVKLKPRVDVAITRNDEQNTWSMGFVMPDSDDEDDHEDDVLEHQYVTTPLKEPANALGVKLPSVFKVVDVLNPQTRDHFIVAPVKDLQEHPRDYVDVKIIPSIRGFVALVKSDGVLGSIAPENQLVLSRTATPLSLSSESDRETKREIATPPPSIKPSDWQEAEKNFDTMVRRMNTGKLLDPKVNHAHMIENREDLAFGFLAKGDIAMAMGSLEFIIDKDPDAEKNPTIRLLHAICHILYDQHDIAQDILRSQAELGDEHALLWQGVASLGQEHFHEGLKQTVSRLKLLKEYPQPVVDPVYMMMAYASHRINYPGQLFLKLMNKEALDRRGKEKYKFLEIALAPLDYAMIGVLQKLCEEGVNDQIRVEACRYLAKNAATPLKDPEKIKALEDIRYRWRGDSLEMELAGELADLYVKTKDYEKALFLYRMIKEHFSQLPQAQDYIHKGQEAFRSHFMNKDAQPKYMAVAFYDRFKEMIPEGEAGNQIVSQLAQDYEDLDLLPQAIRSLEYLVRASKEPKKKGEYLLRQAEIFEKNGEDKNAQVILSQVIAMPEQEAISPQVRFLQSRLLAKHGKTKEALQVIEQDKTQDAFQQKIQLAWGAKDWTLVQRLVSEAILTPGLSGDDQNKLLIKLAVSLNYLKDVKGLAELRQNFAARMGATRFKEQFELLTLPPQNEPQEISKKAYMAQLEEARQFEDLVKKQPKPSL
ncbi:MAG: tetratricopeptide repeat protein [Alphaproteobacteria bacterium]|nr:tetratricopeptide repeat protein [Alphaproteobacteria bacterium]